MAKKLSCKDWIEFIASGVPSIDWYYALTYKATRVERILFPAFVKRPHRDWIIATAEHLLYLILGFAFVRFISVNWSVIVGAFAIFVIIPLEFVYFKYRVRLFKNLSWKKLLIMALWNMFNVSLYWIIGSVLALVV